ncbi:hypothetical protein GJAV_G00270250 [Gymnothorax javanicus]|nr:hypothetical protein GJAV_G00270250 [Gymnothorax javanicus]
MSPFNKFAKNTGKHSVSNKNKMKAQQPGLKKSKRKWVPDGKVFHGSLQEGQGFAYKRKQRTQHEYNKLLRKEKRANPADTAFKSEYPEHLKHLYLAEAEQLRNEEQRNRQRRRKAPAAEEATEEDASATPETGPQSPSTPAAPLPQPDEAESDSFKPSKKKMRKLTSYQKTREEYERRQEKRAKKKEEYLRNKQQREEALKAYKQKKMQTYQMLKKKTRKGQPNLNLQMEYLLQKIHSRTQNQT